MLKVLFNEISDANIKLSVNLSGSFLSITAEEAHLSGADSIESMASYNSYIFARAPGSKVKNFRTISQSDHKFLNMNRLGVAIKMDYADMTQLFSKADILQVDTGLISENERDIIIRVFEGKKENFTIQADMDVEYGTFNSANLPTESHPRTELWDSYSILINGEEYQADRKGNIFKGKPGVPLTIPAGKDYIEIEIQKQKGRFRGPLTRDVDNEEVLIESSVGLLNARRITLHKGYGRVRLYPFGYEGSFKLKLGRKWYEVWNEYNLILGGSHG